MESYQQKQDHSKVRRTEADLKTVTQIPRFSVRFSFLLLAILILSTPFPLSLILQIHSLRLGD